MAYAYVGSFTIDHTLCGSGNSTGFPVYVALSDATLKTTGNGGNITSASGFDLEFFTDQGLASSTPFEIDAYDGAAGTYGAYVSVNISSSANVTVYFGYSDSAVTTSRENTTGLWLNNGFTDVWHFRDGSSLSVTNAVPGGVALTNSGCTATAGLVGQGAISFSGTSTLINSSACNISALPFTVEAWFNVTSVATTQQFLVDLLASDCGMAIHTNKIRLWDSTGFVDSTQAVTANATHYAAASYATTTSKTSYVDGGNPTLRTISGGLSSTASTVIGSNHGGTASRLTGTIDEVRISNVARDANWIKATWNNLNSPSSFTPTITYGLAVVANNSGDLAAQTSYTGSAYWNGTNKMLCIDVPILSNTRTVSSVTYGAANCTLVGTVTNGTQRLEQWRMLASDAGAPAAGSNTLIVTLSGSAEFAVLWVNRQHVQQAAPTEAFTTATGTNSGSATDASLVVSTLTDNSLVHAAIVTNDTTITANQTSRNNVPGTSGSGGDEDPGAATTPIGAVTMSYTGLGTTATWAMAGYAIRPDSTGVGFKYRTMFETGVIGF